MKWWGTGEQNTFQKVKAKPFEKTRRSNCVNDGRENRSWFNCLPAALILAASTGAVGLLTRRRR